jgi:hypothetical protein
MPIGFRCTGCRSRLHVPRRWAGNTVPCPKCGTRVVVPASARGDGQATDLEAEPTAFADAGIERSIASLQVSRAVTPGGIFADDSFELPSPDDRAAAMPIGEAGRGGLTLSRRAVYAYGVLLLLVILVLFVMAFSLGCWWTASGGRWTSARDPVETPPPYSLKE